MKQHKWHKEIKAWADGQTIQEQWDYEDWKDVKEPEWDKDVSFRIKPQPKEWDTQPSEFWKEQFKPQPKESRIIKEMTEAMNDLKKSLGKETQYLYAYKDYVRDDGSTTSKITISSTQLDIENYIGKIKLETEE